MTKLKPSKPAPARKPVKPIARGRTKSTKVKPRKPKSKAIKGRLVWRGVQIAVRYEPESCCDFSHLELRVAMPDAMPLPVTDTGYRSHYVHRTLVKSAGGPNPALAASSTVRAKASAGT